MTRNPNTATTPAAPTAPPQEWSEFTGATEWVEDGSHPGYVPEHLRALYAAARGLSDVELAGFQTNGIHFPVTEEHERTRAGAVGLDGVPATFTETETRSTLKHLDFTPAAYLEQQHLRRLTQAYHQNRLDEAFRRRRGPERVCEVCGGRFYGKHLGQVAAPGLFGAPLPQVTGRVVVACADCVPAVRLALLDAYRAHVFGRTLSDGRTVGEAATTAVAAAIDPTTVRK